MKLSLRALPLLLAPTSPALAQQFVYDQSLPGGFEWTEGVEAVDVDGDGDVDLFTANGEGLYLPDTKLQAGLIINRLEVAPNTYADESLARLGPAVSNAKMVNTADVDADGWVDALYSNCFFTDPPFLFMNRGAGQPGFFDEEGAARGLTTAYSSAGSTFGDVDNDGDLDLVIGDTGPQFNGPPGGRPHLYLNDGNGVFTEAPAAIQAPLKIGHLDVDLVDLDLDWDLDLFGTNRNNTGSQIHHLLLNDGNGNFTDASALVPNTSSNVYEADLGDLDDDGDLDLFFLSLQSFSDGGVRNDFLEDGALGFSAGPALGGDDDNEVSFIDYDMDADLDVVIGSLGPREKLIRNDGSGQFVQLTTEITTIGDRTLDVAIADLDGDLDYDLVTVQGESAPAGWDNKVFLNNGPADTLAPRIQRLETLDAPSPSGPWVVRAQIRDEVHDDGRTWVTGEATWRVDQGAGFGAPQSVGGLASSGYLYRFEMADTAGGAGSRLVYELTFTDVAGNSTSSGEVFVPFLPCGFTAYGTGTAAHTMDLVGTGVGELGSSVDVITLNSPGDVVLTALALGRAEVPFLGGVLLLDLANLVTVNAIDTVPGGSALWIFPLPDNPALTGLPLDFQSFAPDAGQPGGFAFSGGLELVPCP